MGGPHRFLAWASFHLGYCLWSQPGLNPPLKSLTGVSCPTHSNLSWTIIIILIQNALLFAGFFQSWQDRTNTPQKQLTSPMPGGGGRGMGFVCMSWKACLKSFLWESFVGMWWGSQMIYREGVYSCLVIDCWLNFLESLGRISDIYSNGVSKRRRR